MLTLNWNRVVNITGICTTVSEIENSQERELTKSIHSKESSVGQNTDFELVVFALVPIVYHLLTELLKGKINGSQMKHIFIKLIGEHSSTFKDAGTPPALIYIADYLPSDESQARKILDFQKDLPHPTFRNIEMISYLICSLYIPTLEAAELHFKLAAVFPLYKGGTSNNIIIPFYREFWKARMVAEPKSFKEARKLEKNLEKSGFLNAALRLSAIFALTSENIGYLFNPADQGWMSDYLNEYGD